MMGSSEISTYSDGILSCIVLVVCRTSNTAIKLALVQRQVRSLSTGKTFATGVRAESWQALRSSFSVTTAKVNGTLADSSDPRLKYDMDVLKFSCTSVTKKSEAQKLKSTI